MSKQDTTPLTPWQKFFDKDYLGSHNFDDGERKQVKIKYAGKRIVTKPGGKTDECLVIDFAQPANGEPIKPMVVNVTNAKAIQKISGSRHIENWTGTNLTLYVDHNVKYAGKVVDGIRVLIEDGMKAQKDTLTKSHDGWEACVSAIAVKGYTVADIRKKYNVSSDVQAELIAAAEAIQLAQ